jgi:DNA-binding response OmpR family regulator
MSKNVLVVDDDKIVHKIIRRALEPVGFTVSSALDGESGIASVLENKPDIILLDVEMPGANGYEICERLKFNSDNKEVAIVFLSSRSSLRELLQGYEVGADDYLIKPFEKEHLIARLNVLVKYQDERAELKEKYTLAQKTAITAMSGTSELSLAMQFMEKSIGHTSIEELIQGLIATTNQFSLKCCIAIHQEEDQYQWFSSEGTISPLEKELVEMSDKSSRFLDFGCRTVVNYPPISMLVKNMPLDDMGLYGRYKDLMPVLLSIVNTKLNALETYLALIDQSKDLKLSFKDIRKNLFTLASTIVENREHSNELSAKTIGQLSMKLMGMGLEIDQEDYLTSLIETSFSETLEAVDIGQQLRESF